MTHPRRNIKRKSDAEALDSIRKKYEEALAEVYGEMPRIVEEEGEQTIDITHEEVTPKQLPPKA